MRNKKYKCSRCGRDKFDRVNQPHNCKGGFRKRKQIFIELKADVA